MDKNIVERIKKLLRIADDPNASDNEVITATKNAHKLMIKHKINFSELSSKSESIEDVSKYIFGNFSKGYTGYMYYVVKKLAKFNRCELYYLGRINTNTCRFSAYGLNEDLEMLKPMANAILYYLDDKLKRLKKECMTVDFRIYKKSYLFGFASQLEKNLEANLIEAKQESNISDSKFELMITSIPVVVNEYIATKVKPKVVISKAMDILDSSAYERGVSDAQNYNHHKSNLLEQGKQGSGNGGK